MRSIRKLLALLLILILAMVCLTSQVFSQELDNSNKNLDKAKGESKKILPEIPAQFKTNYKTEVWALAKLKFPWIAQDDDSDGMYDSAMIITKNHNLKRMVLDNNDDGLIDNYAYYNDEGKIIFEKIDTNYDKKYDIWISIDDGAKIDRIQRDKNFDGYVDYDKSFSLR